MSALKFVSKAFGSRKKGKAKNKGKAPKLNSKDIDLNMSLSMRRQKRTIRLLLLGPGNSGKSTIMKQIRKVQNVLDPSEMAMIRALICDAVVTYMKLLAFHCRRLAQHIEDDDEKSDLRVSAENEALCRELLALRSPYHLDAALAAKISALWADPAMKRTLEFRGRAKFQIHDNAAYFLDAIARIAHRDYSPSFEDYLRFRTRTTGFETDKIMVDVASFGKFCFEFTDVGGQRSERRKWMKIISTDSVHAVCYVVALSEYDMNCFEDGITNRMTESLTLFADLARDQFFSGKSVLIFLNKYDLFIRKIETVPITVAFEDYPKEKNPNDAEHVVEFVSRKFLDCIIKEKIRLATPLHIHRTYALDTHQIDNLFKTITADLVSLSIKSCGML